MFICKKLEEQNNIKDNAPHSIAAGIVYFIGQICNLNISKICIVFNMKFHENNVGL